MKMCLAPCFKGCSDAEYRAEVVRVEDFLDSRGESLKRQMAAEREDASAKMEFEAAAGFMRGSTNSLQCCSNCRSSCTGLTVARR
jgi:excinuclease UvrABC nuclease subunit